MAIWMRRWGLLNFGKRLMLRPYRKGPVVSRPDFRMGLRHAACSRQARTTSLSPSMAQGAQVLLSRCSTVAYNILARAALSYSVVETTLRLIYPAIYSPRCLQPDIRLSSNHHSALGPTKLEFPNHAIGCGPYKLQLSHGLLSRHGPVAQFACSFQLAQRTCVIIPQKHDMLLKTSAQTQARPVYDSAMRSKCRDADTHRLAEIYVSNSRSFCGFLEESLSPQKDTRSPIDAFTCFPRFARIPRDQRRIHIDDAGRWE